MRDQNILLPHYLFENNVDVIGDFFEVVIVGLLWFGAEPVADQVQSRAQEPQTSREDESR
jgi:hypothetical protein